MTVPLIFLAFLSLTGGFIGIPAVFGGGHALNQFLSPVFEASAQLQEPHHLSHTAELILMGIVVGLTLVVIWLAHSLYVRRKRLPAPEGVSLGAFHRLVYNKYYVDEAYDRAIVRPTNLMSKALDALMERLLIDRIVNSTGRVVTWGGRTLRLLQTGNTGFYIFAMVVSIIVLLVVKTFA